MKRSHAKRKEQDSARLRAVELFEEFAKGAPLVSNAQRAFPDLPADFVRDEVGKNYRRPRGPGDFPQPSVRVFWGVDDEAVARKAREWAATGGEPVFVLPHHGPSREGVYFDDYDGERTMLVEDMGSGWMDGHNLMNLMDPYPFPLPGRHGKKCTCNVTRLAITADRHPKEWYSRDEDTNQRDRLLRRLKEGWCIVECVDEENNA